MGGYLAALFYFRFDSTKRFVIPSEREESAFC